MMIFLVCQGPITSKPSSKNFDDLHFIHYTHRTKKRTLTHFCCIPKRVHYMDISKNRGGPPKCMFFFGKTYERMDDFGGFPTIFASTPWKKEWFLVGLPAKAPHSSSRKKLIPPGNCWAKSLHLESRSTWRFLRFVGCRVFDRFLW